MKIDKNKLEEMCEHLSEREKNASKAERESIRYKQVEYLKDKLNKVYDGVISGISNYGVYVELSESKCEGIIKISSLVDHYVIDSVNYKMISKNKTMRLGDVIKVKVSNVDIIKREVTFTLF